MILVSDNSDESQEPACARTFLAMRAAGVIVTPADRTGGGAPLEGGDPGDRGRLPQARQGGLRRDELGQRARRPRGISGASAGAGAHADRASSPIQTGRRRLPHGYVAAHVAHGADLDERLILPLAFRASTRKSADRTRCSRSGGRRPSSRRTTSSRSTRGACSAGAALRMPHDISLVGRRRRLDGDGRPGHHRGRAAHVRDGRRAAAFLRRAADPGAPRSIEMLRSRRSSCADRRRRVVAQRRILSIPLTNPLASRLCVVTFSHENSISGNRPSP